MFSIVFDRSRSSFLFHLSPFHLLPKYSRKTHFSITYRSADLQIKMKMLLFFPSRVFFCLFTRIIFPMKFIGMPEYIKQKNASDTIFRFFSLHAMVKQNKPINNTDHLVETMRTRKCIVHVGPSEKSFDNFRCLVEMIMGEREKKENR